MGLFGSSGLKSAASSVAQIISSLIGQDIVAKSISASQAAGSDAFKATVAGARWHLGPGTTDYFSSDGATVVTAAGALTVSGAFTTASGQAVSIGGTLCGVVMAPNATDIYGAGALRLNHPALSGFGSAGSIANVGGMLNMQSTPTSNVNTGETDLFTYSLPANSLISTNRGLVVSCYGSNLGSATTKTLKFYFGAAIQTVTLPITNAGDWELSATIVRTGSSTQRFAVRLAVENDAAATVASFTVTQGTAAQTETAGITIKVTGQDSVGSGAITANLWSVTAL